MYHVSSIMEVPLPPVSAHFWGFWEDAVRSRAGFLKNFWRGSGGAFFLLFPGKYRVRLCRVAQKNSSSAKVS